MKNEIHKELVKYLTTILEELCIERSQEKNIIDESVHHQSKLGFMKKCNTCQTANIDNKKRNCPTYNAKLPIMAKMNQQSNELIEIINANEKPLVILPYIYESNN